MSYCQASESEKSKVNLLKWLNDNGYPIRTVKYNPNPTFKMKELNGYPLPKSRNDCSTRAMCKVLGEPFKKIWHEQSELAEKYYIRYNIAPIMDEIMSKRGYNYYFYGAIPNQSHLILTFLLTHLTGRYLISSMSHCFAYIDGVIYDDFWSKPDQRNGEFTSIVTKPIAGYFAKEEHA